MQDIARGMLQTSWTMLRIIAVVSSSVATIISSVLPLLRHSSISYEKIFVMFLLVSFGALIIHGALTHLWNDYADYLSGTDAYSPAILSGGSRVIQKELMTPEQVRKFAIHLTVSSLVVALVLAIAGYIILSVLVIVGVWAAFSYSMPPLRLSYRPFVGEGLSLFPAMFFLGLAIPWLLLDSLPIWAYQNALINAFICMAWVMVHHIPDVDADQKSIPVKRTSVVWFVQKFGMRAASVPAVLYLFLACAVTLSLFPSRFWQAMIVCVLLLYMVRLVLKMDSENVQTVTNVEKLLLLFAIIIAVLLGVF